MVGLAALAIAAVLPRRARPDRDERGSHDRRGADISLVCANPVRHGSLMMAEVLKQLRDRGWRVALVADTRLADERLDVGHNFPGLGFRSLVKDVRSLSLAAAWRDARAASRADRGVRPGGRVYGHYLLVAQALRYQLAFHYLASTRPRLVLLDFDRPAYARPLIHAARALEIATATLVHGSPQAATYLPVLADHVLVWGEAQRAFFRREKGEAQVHVVGRLAGRSVKSASTAGTQPRIVVCHSMEDLTEEEEAGLVRLVRSARRAGVRTELRPHPRDPTLDHGVRWSTVSAEVDGRHSDPGSADLSWLARDDIVVVVSSTVAVDALQAGASGVVIASEQRELPCDLVPLRASFDAVEMIPTVRPLARVALQELVAAEGERAGLLLNQAVKQIIASSPDRRAHLVDDAVDVVVGEVGEER
jgi:hypothetical protein